MNAGQMRRVLLLPLGLFLIACDQAPTPAGEVDFTVLARSAGDFAQARRGQALSFPRDHGAHPDFRIEWWYLTANLEGPDGESYGAQWTLFRVAAQPPGARKIENAWQSEQVFMAHMAITTPSGHTAFQRYARAGDHNGIAQAGVNSAPFAAWLDDWSLRSLGPEWLPLEVRARQGGHSLRLRLDSNRPLVLQGDGGFSQKHPQGGGSHYYSHPFLEAEGELRLDGKTVQVKGAAWLDREWSSQFLQPDQAGWDWFALHLDSGEKLMLFSLRGKSGTMSEADYRHGVLISPQGNTTLLDPARMTFRILGVSAVEGRLLPLHWRIALPQIDRELEVQALHPGQWLGVDFPYWEGVVTASGDGPVNSGHGYMELTGYTAVPGK